MDTDKPSPPATTPTTPRFPSFRNWLSFWGGILGLLWMAGLGWVGLLEGKGRAVSPSTGSEAA